MSIVTRLRENWKSGLTVALINIPLSLSLAVAAQSTPTAGIITAVWAGFVAAMFGGSNYNVYGPAGALSGILAAFSLAHGAGTLPMLAIITGVMVLVSYAARLERFLIFIPGSAVQGFTLSVAATIGFGQFNSALGLKGLPTHAKFLQNLAESFRHIGSLDWPTTITFLLFIVGLFVLVRAVPRIPGAILLSPLGILLGYLTTRGMLPFHVQTLADRFGTISTALVQKPHFAIVPGMISTAVTVSIVAILETMLSAKIADGMTKTKHKEHKEMLGLGLANLVSGLAGGLPATAVLARTAINVKSGATHRTSQGLNAVLTAVISVLLLSYFKFIPMAVIAAILVFASIRMVEAGYFSHSFRHDRLSFFLAVLVGFVCVYLDPLYGILTGTVISVVLFMDKLSRGQFEMLANSLKHGVVGRVSGHKLEEISEKTDILAYAIRGELVYINSKAHIARFEELGGRYKHVILRLRELYFIDRDGVDALDEIIELCEKQGKNVAISGVAPSIDHDLSVGSKSYRRLKESGMVFTGSQEALAQFGYDLDKLGRAA